LRKTGLHLSLACPPLSTGTTEVKLTSGSSNGQVIALACLATPAIGHIDNNSEETGAYWRPTDETGCANDHIFGTNHPIPQGVAIGIGGYDLVPVGCPYLAGSDGSRADLRGLVHLRDLIDTIGPPLAGGYINPG
jgi:hypothetical protein